jgi:selenoprotein W-related protein
MYNIKRGDKMIKKLLLLLVFLVLVSGGVFAEELKENDSLKKYEDMMVEIHHCTSCGFRARAVSLAEEIKKEFGVEAKLLIGKIGSFDVIVDGELIFSKHSAGRFPENDEIVQKINEYTHK